VSIIFSKLDVNSRRQAIVRGPLCDRSLGRLP
jgi:hypothetical protein